MRQRSRKQTTRKGTTRVLRPICSHRKCRISAGVSEAAKKGVATPFLAQRHLMSLFATPRGRVRLRTTWCLHTSNQSSAPSRRASTPATTMPGKTRKTNNGPATLNNQQSNSTSAQSLRCQRARTKRGISLSTIISRATKNVKAYQDRAKNWSRAWRLKTRITQGSDRAAVW